MAQHEKASTNFHRRKSNIKFVRRHSIYVYLCIAFILLLFPVLLISLFALRSSVNEIRQQQNQQLESQLLAKRSQMETDIQEMLNGQRKFIINEDIGWSFTEKYDSFDPETRVRQISRLAKSLYMTRGSNVLVSNAYLYIPSIQIEIRDDGYFEDKPEQIDQRLYDQAFLAKKSVFFYDGNLYSTAVFFPSITRTYGCCAAIKWNIDLLPAYWSMQSKDTHFAVLHDEFSYFSDIDTSRSAQMLEFLNDQPSDSNTTFDSEFKHDNAAYVVSSVYSEMTDCRLISYYPLSLLTGQMQKYMALTWLVGIGGLAAALGVILLTRRMIKRPLDNLLKAFDQVQDGNLDVQAEQSGDNEFSQLITCFNLMVMRLKKLIEESYESEIRLKNVTLRQLQAQISPHFLHNSFSTITHAIKGGDMNAAQLMAKSLSRYFYYITQNNQDMELLENELGFTKAYINIQSIRYGDRIKVKISEPSPEFMHMKVPRMIIQPLVENAYKHGFKYLEFGGELSLSCRTEGRELLISVDDNGIGMSEESLCKLRCSLRSQIPSEHNGLFNVHERLYLRYHIHALSIESSQNGLSVTIRIPLEGL